MGRSFDGLHYSYSKAADDFTFVAAVPTRGVFQTDGWGWNRIGFGYAAYTHEWGKGRHAADTRFFALEYDDWRHILKTDNRPTAVRRGDTENILINTFGGHSLHAFTTGAGTLDLLAWGAIQTGRWGTQQQRSYAIDFEGGFQPQILPKLKPWLRGGFIEGSGDGNPNDNTHGTFFQVLPTPRPYARFPFFNMMNTQDSFGSLVLRPHPKVTVSSEFHSLRLSNANDLWYSGGGAYQPWTFGYTGRSTSGPPVARESVRHERRLSGYAEDHSDRLSRLCAGPCRDRKDLPREARKGSSVISSFCIAFSALRKPVRAEGLRCGKEVLLLPKNVALVLGAARPRRRGGDAGGRNRCHDMTRWLKSCEFLEGGSGGLNNGLARWGSGDTWPRGQR